MRKRRVFQLRWWLVYLQVIPVVMAANACMDLPQVEVEKVFRETIMSYFELILERDMRAIKAFEEITTEDFFAYIRDERQINRKEWLQELETYLANSEWVYRYEIQKVSVEMLAPNKAVVHTELIETRLWRDSEGVFGQVGQLIQITEPLEADFVLVKMGDNTWKWAGYAHYGLGKRWIEHKKGGDLQ